MIKTCELCGKSFDTNYPSKCYCSEKCAKKSYYERGIECYDFPHNPDDSPIYSFQCKECGRTVFVYSKYDQRNTFCCGFCAKMNKLKLEREKAAKKKSSNIGMSGAMSLGSLIRREARSSLKD